MDLNFTLSVEQTNVIMEALGNAPYRVAAPIVQLLQQQAAPQLQPQLVPSAVDAAAYTEAQRHVAEGHDAGIA